MKVDRPALTGYVRQLGVDALDRLGPALAGSPAAVVFAASALLVALLIRLAHSDRSHHGR